MRPLLLVSLAAIGLLARCSARGPTIVADIPTTSRVDVGTTVRFRGTEIGHVTRVTPIRIGVHLELTLNRSDALVRTDDHVAVRPDGIFGGVFVDIVPGSDNAPPIPPNAALQPVPPDSLASVREAVMRAAGDALLNRLQDDLRRPPPSGSRP